MPDSVENVHCLFRCRYGASELHSVAAFIGGETRHRWPRSHVPNVPWVPETFHARFPVSVRFKSSLAASPLVSLAEGRRRVGLRPTKLHVTREKKSLVPRVSLTWILCQKMLLKEVKKAKCKKMSPETVSFRKPIPLPTPQCWISGKICWVVRDILYLGAAHLDTFSGKSCARTTNGYKREIQVKNAFISRSIWF